VNDANQEVCIAFVAPTDSARYHAGVFAPLLPSPSPRESPRAPREDRAAALLIVLLLGAGLARGLLNPWRPHVHGNDAVRVWLAPHPTDDAAGLEARVVALIDAATSSIHAALYELGMPSVAMALRRARARGLDVRLFLEGDNVGTDAERSCLRLLDGVVPMRVDHRPTLMHDKFLIIDQRIVWTGSVNLTWTGCHLHHNEAIEICDPRVAERFDDQFARLFDARPDAEALPPVEVGETRIACAFSRGAARLQPWLQATASAQRRIRVAAFSLTHPALVDALAQRARSGVVVDVVLDARLAHGRPGRRAARALAAAGCHVSLGGPRLEGALLRHFGLPRHQDLKIHHKLLIADDGTVVSGSANLSTNGFERNDENVVTLWVNEALSSSFTQAFDAAAADSTPMEVISEDVRTAAENPPTDD